jgi:hypothetical protein
LNLSGPEIKNGTGFHVTCIKVMPMMPTTSTTTLLDLRLNFNMAELIWKAPMKYYSQTDEASFFGWLQSIPGVTHVEGRGRELVIHLRSMRLSATSLRELIALYKRYDGNMSELAQFANGSNSTWFRAPTASWHKAVFGK